MAAGLTGVDTSLPPEAASLRDRLWALRAAAKYDDAVAVARDAAATLPDGQARAVAMLEAARGASDLGDDAAALQAWRTAIVLAAPLGDRGAAIRALAGSELALLALRDGMADEAAALAGAAAEQAGLVDGPVPDVAIALVNAAVVRGETDRSEDGYAAAWELLARSAPHGVDLDGPEAARAEVLLQAAHGTLGRVAGVMEPAMRDLERAGEIAVGRLGPSPRDLAAIAAERGLCARAAGRLADAEAALRDALRSLAPVGGDAHPDAVTILGNLGAVALALAATDAPAGAVLQREVLARLEAVGGEDRPEVAMHWNNLGGVLSRAGDLDSAGAAYERSLTLKDTYGAPPDSLVVTLVNLAGVWRRSRRHAPAEAAYRRALSLLDDIPDADGRTRRAIEDGLREIGRARGPLISLQPRRPPSEPLH